MNARVLTTFRFYQLFRGVDFAGAIWVPFLLERGFSLPQVGLIEAVLHVGMLGAQIPTGALADTLGRRRMLVAAGFFTAVSQLGLGLRAGAGRRVLCGARRRRVVRPGDGLGRGVPVRRAGTRRRRGALPAHAGRPLGRVPVRRGDLVRRRRLRRRLDLARARLRHDGRLRAGGQCGRAAPAGRPPRPLGGARPADRPPGRRRAADLAAAGRAHRRLEPAVGDGHRVVAVHAGAARAARARRTSSWAC